MIRNTLRPLLMLPAFLMLPSVASAHVVFGQTSGFLHGLSHPLTGLDHVLAMVMVGVLAYQLGGRARWVLPVSFVLLMAVGGGLGMTGIVIPYVEAGIAASLLVLGAVVAFGINVPLTMALGLVGLFAVFHGHAHGAEMPSSAAGLAYGAGFMFATSLLHGAGMAGAAMLTQGATPRRSVPMRVAGGLTMLAGMGFLFAAL